MRPLGPDDRCRRTGRGRGRPEPRRRCTRRFAASRNRRPGPCFSPVSTEDKNPSVSVATLRRFQKYIARRRVGRGDPHVDRKSTRLNSSHLVISYAVFCLKKKKKR